MEQPDGTEQHNEPSEKVAQLADLRATQGQQLLGEASRLLPAYSAAASMAVAAQLRATHDPDLIAAALTQVRLRERARTKFGADADRMFFSADGLEQATGRLLAQRRAQRYVEAGISRVADLCCGLGADALAFARAGLAVLALDLDPEAAALTAANAHALGLAHFITAQAADVRQLSLPADLGDCDAAFCDPARRDAHGRRLQPETWSPPLSWVRALAEAVPATGAKVAPGIPHDLVPPGVEAEWVSLEGGVKEAALWWGPLRTGAGRRATLLPSGATLAEESLGPPPVDAPRRYLYEPDGAVIRAGLVAEMAARVDGALLDATIAYVTSDRLVPTPFATAYEITDVLPFSVKPLRALLRQRDVGAVTVKKRGSAVEPEELRRQLRLGGGKASAVVILTRVQGRPTTLIAQPTTVLADALGAPG